MRLVMVYSEGDGCTYSCENTVPFVYESAEAALVDFETLMLKTKGQYGDVMFAGHSFDPTSFFEERKFYAPRILTVDEWFAGYAK